MENNKKEQLLDKISGLGYIKPSMQGGWFNNGVTDALNCTEKFFNEELIPEVPQYVADWYEEHKDDFEFSVFNYLYTLDDQECSAFKKWLVDSKTEPFQTLVNMHQFGYTVEKESKYTVKVKGITGYCRYLNKDLDDGAWFFASDAEIKSFRVKHTHKELEEAGFGWVFDCEGMKVEKVEEND